MIDSTGLRIHVGTARKPPKQRAWRKLHIAVDRETGNIVASELTASRARDATRVPALLTQIQAPLVSVAADSAYDKEAVYEAIEAHSPGRRTRVVIPPQRNATLSQNSNTAMQERDRHIRAIARHGRREWYKLSGCTKRSMVENAVYRYKAMYGAAWRFDDALNNSEDSSTLNTSFIERLNLTIRQSSAYLSRRTLSHARSTERLDEHLELLRCYYNFVRPHGALKFGREIRTPAMQAGLTIRRLTFRDIFLATTIPLWLQIEVFLLSWARNPVSSEPVPLPAAA